MSVSPLIRKRDRTMTLQIASASAAGANAPVRCCVDERTLTLDRPMRLDSGERAASMRVGMRLVGASGSRQPVVLVMGGISADRRAVASVGEHEPGWWQGVLGAEGVDLVAHRRVLSFDFLGGAGTTACLDAGGREWTPRRISTEDQARIAHRLIRAMGLEQVTILSASYGAMVALHFARLFPQACAGVLCLAGAHRPEPMAVARRWVQKQLLELCGDPAQSGPAVAIARALAVTTYRSAREFRHRFGGPDGIRSLQGYLEHQGAKFQQRFSSEQYRLLLDSIDDHALNPADLRIPLNLVSFDSDELCPPALVRELAARANAATKWHRLQSIYGHDAFLCEQAKVAGLVARFLEAC